MGSSSLPSSPDRAARQPAIRISPVGTVGDGGDRVGVDLDLLLLELGLACCPTPPVNAASAWRTRRLERQGKHLARGDDLLDRHGLVRAVGQPDVPGP